MFAGLAGLGLFAAGYLVGRPDVGANAGESGSSTRTADRPNRQDPLESGSEPIRAKPAQKSADGKQAGYRKIVEMVRKGELRINGVDINGENFLPGDKVAEFFDLSGDQLAEMKRLGLERLQEKKNREQSLAKIQEVSESGMVFDLPADPDFSAIKAAQFTEDLRRTFGPDVAAMLQPSIETAYSESVAPRYVRYSLTRRDELANLPADAPKEVRASYEGMYDYKISTNQNEDGSYMRNEQG